MKNYSNLRVRRWIITSIGERIKYARKLFSLSQAEFAKSINVSAGNVGDWERGKAKPGFDALVGIIEFCDISSLWLLTGAGSPKQTASTLLDLDLSKEEFDIILLLRELPEKERIKIEGMLEYKVSEYRQTIKDALSTYPNGGGEEAATIDTA